MAAPVMLSEPSGDGFSFWLGPAYIYFFYHTNLGLYRMYNRDVKLP